MPPRASTDPHTLPDRSLLPGLARAALEQHWGISGADLIRLDGGMNSWAALVRTPERRLALKCVPRAFTADLERGALIGDRLSRSGLDAGASVPTCDGARIAVPEWGAAVLMHEVTGRELTQAPEDQQRMAHALVLIHASTPPVPRRASFIPHLGNEPRLAELGSWILPRIQHAVEAFRSLPETPWGTLNGDPSPDSFLWDERTGRVGVIDWTSGGEGPLLYDVASAVMYLDGAQSAQPFLHAYAAEGPVPQALIDEQLTVFRRLRAAVQADCFGRRILTGDLTGIESPAENQVGLDDARSMFDALDEEEG